MKPLVSILFLSFAWQSFSQTFDGTISDPSKQGLPGVKVQNLRSKKAVRSNNDGTFSIPAQAKDTIQFTLFGYDSLQLVLISKNLVTSENSIKMRYSFQEIEEAVVERELLKGFDVGVLPPVKGVQITTGTNAVIGVESLNGAKSVGNPRELYARIPGLNIWESDGAGIQLGIGGRGLSPKRAANFNTRQNGYDISADALGYPESYYTPATEALSSIEIVRGSASLQFGTQFGGLLNFIIREPPVAKSFEITSATTFRQYGYQGYFNRIAGTKGRWKYQIYHQYKTGKGYRANSAFDQTQLFAQAGYAFTENLSLTTEYTHMNYLAQQAGGLSDVQFRQDPRASYRERNWFAVNWNVYALHLDWQLGKNGTLNWRNFGVSSSRKALGFLGKVTQQDPGGNREMIDGDFNNVGSELRYLQKYNLALDATSMRGAFLVGSRYYQGKTTNQQGAAPDGSDADFRFVNPDSLEGSSYDFPSENLSFFAENILFLSPKLSVHVGFRQEFIRSASEGYYRLITLHPNTQAVLNDTTISDGRINARAVTLAGGGASYKISRALSTYANFTQNYRAINFSDIRIKNPNIEVDSAIRDEYGYTAEIGFRGTWQRFWTYDVAGFYIFYGDKIGVAPQPGKVNRIRTNIGDAQNYGIEAFTEFDFIQAFADSSDLHLRLFVNTAYIQSNYIRSQEPNFIGKQVEYVAPFILRTGLKFSNEKWSTQLQVSYTGDQFSDASNAVTPSSDATIGLVPAYTVADFNVRYKVKAWWTVEAGVNNLTNADYFTRRATAYPGPGILPADGISVYGSMRFQLAFRVSR